VELARKLGKEAEAIRMLEAAHARAPSLDVSEALAITDCP